jgi:N-methylhydantoinase A
MKMQRSAGEERLNLSSYCDQRQHADRSIMKTIGVDVGGTFTDIVYCDLDTGQVAIHKVSTTPDDPSRAIIQGIAEICCDNGIEAGDIDYVLHGTTTATNAVLEHKGARAGMLTNEGFRDIIHIARHQRAEHYSIMQELPWQNRPLVKRRHRKVVKGRLVPPHGAELEPLDEAGVIAAARALKVEAVEAVAVCFLFSYLNPAHEERAKAILERELPGVFVVTSSSISPQFREYERFTTACLCAFIAPKMRGYVDRLAATLRDAGLRSELRVMASNGGVATPAMVSEKPAMTLLSGLAAGVLGGAWIGGLSGRRKLVTFDIGGTSADIGIVVEGRFAETDARSTSIAGFPLLLPMIDIHTIGAGGGSIAYIDHGGAFRVGPRSAGAVPGPAAYGRGGTEPTVTDANLVLGRLDKNDFLAGSMKLDEAAAHRAIEQLADALGMNKLDAAEGVLTVINSNMANAIRSRTVQKGIDPREFALVAFGGAGPLHAVEVAAMLGFPEVIVPPYPGITSAMGLLTTDLKYDIIRTEFQVSGSVDLDRLNADMAAMELQLRKQFAADHLQSAGMSFMRGGDLRYVGQGYELKIPFPEGVIGETELEEIWRRFHEAHKREYGHFFAANPIEIVNVRVVGVGHMPKLEKLTAPEGTTLAKARVRTGQCVFRIDGELRSFETAFYRRHLLPVGETFEGPAIVLQKDSTTVIPPGCTAINDASGNLILKVAGDGR